MIQEISIENFQSHKSTNLKLDEGVNVIHGLSQSGKTAIIRALNWTCFNRPSGFRFHSHFSSDPTKVEITIDGHPILHYKDDNESFYRRTGQRFAAFGQSIPKPIEDALNLSSINFSNQLDPLFLVTNTPGEVGKIFNQITKIERVDKWVSNLTTKINDSNAVLKITQNEIEELEGQINSLLVLDDLQPLIDKYVKYEDRIKSLSEIVSKSKILVGKYYKTRNLIKGINIKKIEILFDQYAEIRQEEINIEKDIIYIKDRLEQYQKAQYELRKNKVLHLYYGQLHEVHLKIEKKADKIGKINRLKSMYEKTSQDKIQLEKRFKTEVGRYISILKKEGKCPTCFSTITQSKIKEIEKDLL